MLRMSVFSAKGIYKYLKAQRFAYFSTVCYSMIKVAILKVVWIFLCNLAVELRL